MTICELPMEKRLKRGVCLLLVFVLVLLLNVLLLLFLSSRLEKNFKTGVETISKDSRGNGTVGRNLWPLLFGGESYHRLDVSVSVSEGKYLSHTHSHSHLVDDGPQSHVGQKAIAQGIRNDVNAHSTASKSGYCSIQVSSSETTMDRITNTGPGVLNASHLTLSQGLSFSVLMTRKYSDISIGVLLGIVSATLASCFCLYRLTVEVLFALAIVREETSGALANSVKEFLDTWAKMAVALKDLVQGQETFFVMKFLERYVVQEGSATFNFYFQLETSNEYCDMRSGLMHIPREEQAIDAISWTGRQTLFAFLEWSREKSSRGPLGIAAVTLTVSFGCLLLKLNIFIDVSQKERSGKEWLLPALSFVLTVMLTLHFICSSSHYIDSGGGGLSSFEQLAFSSVLELGVVEQELDSKKWTEATKEESIDTNALEPAGNFFTTSRSRAGNFHQKCGVAGLYHKFWNFMGNASAHISVKWLKEMLLLCLVAFATVAWSYRSVSEVFMRLTVDVFLEALTTSTTQTRSNCLYSENVFDERRFSALRSFDVSPTETAENESFSERNKVDFLQKLAATDDGFLPSTIPFIHTPKHWKDTQRFRGDKQLNEASASGRSRTKGSGLFSAFSVPSLFVPFDNISLGPERLHSVSSNHADEPLAVDLNQFPPYCYLVERSDEDEDGRTLQLDSIPEREAAEKKKDGSRGTDQAAQLNFVPVKLPLNNQSSRMLFNTNFQAVVAVDADRSRVPTLLASILSQLEKRRSAGEHVFLLVLAVHSTGKRKPSSFEMTVERLERWLQSKLGDDEYTVAAVEDCHLIEEIRKNSVKNVTKNLVHSLTEICGKLRKLKMSKAIATLTEIDLSDLAKVSMTEKEMLTYLRNFGLIWYEGLADTTTSDSRILIDLSSPEKNLRQLLKNSVVAKQLLNGGYVKKSVLLHQIFEDERLLVSFLEHTGYILSHGHYMIIPRELRVRSHVTRKLNCVRLEPLIFQLENVAILPRFVFHNVALRTLEEYPHAAHFYANEVLLRVETDHELMIAYGVSHLEAVMIIRTDDQTLKTTETGSVCVKVKRRLLEIFRTVCREAFGDEMCDVRLGIDAFDRHDARDLLHFIDLTDVNSVSESEALKFAYKDSPPKFLYAWFNETEPASVVQKKFHYYSERLNLTSNFDRVMDGLVAKGYASDKEISRIYAPSDLKARVNVLLNYFVRRGKTGDAILRELLPDEEDHGRATTLPASVETSAQTPLVEAMQSLNDPLSRQSRIASPSMASTSVASYQAAATPMQPTSVQPEDKEPSTFLPTVSERGRGVIHRGLAEPTTPEIDRQVPVQSQFTREPQGMSVSPSGKQDPPVSPIFEAKYYHVERASDYFNERPFKEGGKRLGSGSFGTVYHGVLHSETGEKFEVAIKRLKKASSLNPAQIELSRKQFGVEMNILTRYCYKNIIGLVGFSSDGPELCLIYEFMPNGALSHRLDCRDNTPPLRWQTRLTVSADIASGLDFLHNKYRLPVIHRDVKSSNVLLSSSFQAKLSDFGLAVVANADGEADSTGPSVGTRPYMGPEVFHKIITPLGDVYGFGMILYELSTGLPPYSSKKKQDLKSYVDAIESQGIDLTKMLDPKAKWPKTKNELYGLELLTIAKRATEDNYRQRPGVTSLLLDLNLLKNKAGVN